MIIFGENYKVVINLNTIIPVRCESALLISAFPYFFLRLGPKKITLGEMIKLNLAPHTGECLAFSMHH